MNLFWRHYSYFMKSQVILISEEEAGTGFDSYPTEVIKPALVKKRKKSKNLTGVMEVSYYLHVSCAQICNDREWVAWPSTLSLLIKVKYANTTLEEKRDLWTERGCTTMRTIVMRQQNCQPSSRLPVLHVHRFHPCQNQELQDAGCPR